MMDFLKSWVLNIAALGLMIVIFEIIVPSGKTKKFINLVAGFILIIAVINPFVKYFSKGFDFKDIQLKDSNVLDQKELEQQSKTVDEKQKKQIAEVYKAKIKMRIEASAKEVEGVSEAKAEIAIDENYESENFGEIKSVILNVVHASSNKEIKMVSKVNKIDISAKKAETKVDSISEDLKGKIEDKLSKLFDIEKKNIVISGSD
jgi:stage III sporulation protein AF